MLGVAIFKVGQFPIWGLMATEVTRLFFAFKEGGGSSNPNVADSNVYIDLAAAMSAANRKQYHQVKKNGTPLCYAVTLTVMKTRFGSIFEVAKNNWTVRNAVKKTAIGWKAQLKHGGVKVSDLPTYAKRFRCAWEDAAIQAAPSQGIVKQIVPLHADQHTSLFESYTDSLGNAATYQSCNETVIVPIGDPVVDYRMVLMGDSSAGDEVFGITCEFLKSRRNIRDASDPALEFPDPDNLLDPLFATSEELSDDIVDAADDYNTQRPYDETTCGLSVVGARAETSAVGITQTYSMICPLGLIKMSGIINPIWDSGEAEYQAASHSTDVFYIDVHAIYEM